MLDQKEFPESLRLITAQTLVVDDTAKQPGVTDLERNKLQALGFGGLLIAVLRKGERNPAWSIVVSSVQPRRWTTGEIQLVEEATERTWAALERARAESALRESEERFQQFAAASSGALWIRDATTLTMEYASPAMADIYGAPVEAMMDGIERWAAMIVPEDRDAALAQIERAREGKSVVAQYRIQRPDDKAFRWIRNTNFPLLDEHGRLHRIGGIGEDITEAKLAIEHQGVLLAELQHRVRNIMAIIRSVASRTGQRAQSVAEYASLITGRSRALARVQALLTRAANMNVGIRTIVQDEIAAQAQHEEQYSIEGPDVALAPKAAEVLTLAVHELATNALKYGALSVPNGKITVAWDTVERRGASWVAFDWTEEGAPEQPQLQAGTRRRRGFGSELIEGRVPYELGGKGKVTIGRATVFGGALDMNGEPDLSGFRILIVEDDSYLATDAARALQGAGAAVSGPSPNEAAARAELAEQQPDAAVVDINLGQGLSCKFAEVLKDRGIPFVFVTGYDQDVIPKEFAAVERLEKPVQLSGIVAAVAKLVKAA